MDVLLKGPLVLQEKKMKKVDYADDPTTETGANISKEHEAQPSERSSRDATSPPSSPTQKEIISGNDQEDELLIQSAEAEMSEVKEENERLKALLARIKKDYQSLQMQFLDVVQQQEEPNSKIEAVPPHQTPKEEADLVSLSLGTSTRGTGAAQRKEEKASTTGSMNEVEGGDDRIMGGGLTLGLMGSTSKFEGGSSSASTQPTTNLSLESSFDDPKEEEGADQEWPPSKVLKPTARTTVEDEVSRQMQIKKARVSVRTRCDGTTMNDGCQWRKYGQKISKGNPCPRAYYRCTVAPGCPVRKQVQRCADDMSILISTYEGTHNHPLPMAATAMASTTAAAASMLLSGSSSSSSSSSTSRSNILTSPFSTLNSTPSSTLHGLSFSVPDSSRAKPYFLPSTVPSLAATAMHPTITLDLTAPSSSATTSTPFNRSSFPSPFASSIPRYPPNLTFSSTDTNSMQSPWNKLYGNAKNQIGSSSSSSSSSYQSPFLKNSNGAAAAAQPTQQALSDTLAKVITSDPSFKSALASAINTIVGGGQGGAATQSQSAGLGSQLSGMSPFGGGGGGGGGGTTSAPSFSTRLVQNPSSSFFLQPSLGLSNSMSSSSKVEKRDHIM